MKKFYWLNDNSRSILSKGYLEAGMTPEARLQQIAMAAEKILGKKGFAEKFLDYMSRGWYSLSSPVWSNFGNNRGLSISCNGSYVGDNMQSILYKVAEVGMMSKYGAGTSIYVGDLRPRGTPISVGGHSSGPVHFLELFDSVVNIVSQSNIRRGNLAAYLDVDHPDIMEFLQIKSDGHPIQHISIGVCISDEFMQGMIDGDPEKRAIQAAIIQKKFESGYPYIMFSDTTNKNKPQVYKDKDMRIHASNLCVTGDQRVPSNYGLLTAKELYEIGTDLILFDNQKQVKSGPMNLIQKDADVYKITLENGQTHTITDYHKIPVRVKDSPIITENRECRDLRIGDLVAIQTNKGVFGTEDMQDEAFLLGLYQADGTQNKDHIHICLWENDFDLLDEVEDKFKKVYNKYDCDSLMLKYKSNREIPLFKESVTFPSTVRKKTLSSVALKRALNFEKGYVPHWIWKSNEKTQWEYIRGLFYADGTVNVTNGKGNPFYLSIANINEEFLKELQILLLNLGITSSISIMHEAGERMLPDGLGGAKLYACKTIYRLVCGSKNDGIEFEKNTKFLSRKNIYLDKEEHRDNTKKFRKIKSIEHVGKEDVYCVTVDSEEHHWVCNGVITHNCSEIQLSSSDSESFVCNLSSMNLLHYDEWKDTDAVETLFYFLDAVMTEYIDKTETIPFMTEAHNFAKNQRAIGLGVLGWHSYLQSKMIPFESMGAKYLNTEIFKLLDEKTLAATKSLAQEYGEPELLIDTGLRNVTRMAIAPTTSSSLILGQVSPSIEAITANYYVESSAKGNFTYKNPILMKLLEDLGENTSKNWEIILRDGGSVRNLPFLTDLQKDVFKTAHEISQMEVLIQAANRQKYIDQSQSLNLFIHKDTPVKEVNRLIIEAWKSGIKTLYYQRGTSSTQGLIQELNQCKSCEG